MTNKKVLVDHERRQARVELAAREMAEKLKAQSRLSQVRLRCDSMGTPVPVSLCFLSGGILSPVISIIANNHQRTYTIDEMMAHSNGNPNQVICSLPKGGKMTAVISGKGFYRLSAELIDDYGVVSGSRQIFPPGRLEIRG